MAKAMDFAAKVYQVTKIFPRDEIYGLTSQLRRAAVSVAANIAEGQGRQSTGEFRQFPRHAGGSLLEAETHILLAQRMEYASDSATSSLLEDAAELGAHPEWADRIFREGQTLTGH